MQVYQKLCLRKTFYCGNWEVFRDISALILNFLTLISIIIFICCGKIKIKFK
ncbi:putative 6-kDa protein b [Citrus associated ampelovirus 2]|nr:putative 6-kDa protein b [Citrus associated ampelovirus 2]